MRAETPTRDVVRLITRLNIGGPARQALLLTKELADRWPTMLLAGKPTPDEGELTDPRVHVHRVPLVRRVDPVHDLQALRRVSSLLRTARPKIVHTHMAKAGMIGRLAARRLHVRTIHTYHGHVHQGYFNPPVQRLFLEIERHLARHTDILIAISPEIREELLELRIGRPDQYRVIPLGFDLTSHLAVSGASGRLRDELGLAPNVPLIGIVGRLVDIKDVGTMLRALARTNGVHLAVIGDGDSRAALEREARDLGIAARTHFTGWWHDIPAAMSDLDIVALTSRNEGTPVSLIEALACERPVVATDVGGVRFVVRDGETGLLCRPQDPAAFAGAIQRLFEQPDFARRLAIAGRASVRSRFHKDRLLSDISAVYEELAKR